MVLVRSRARSRRRAASTSRAARGERSVCPVADDREPRLPVAHLGLRAPSISASRDVGRIRDDEVERAGEPVEQARLDELDREPEPLRVLAGERERVGRDVGRGDARAGRSSAIASAIAPLPVPTSTTRGASTPAIAASARSTTISVSGRGTSARASVRSVSRRKPHSPRT